LDVDPREWYYLIRVYRDGTLILFDYSCTIEPDGPVLDCPGAFDPDNIDNYDRCK